MFSLQCRCRILLLFIFCTFNIKSCLVKGENPTHTFYEADRTVREISLSALVCTSALLPHYSPPRYWSLGGA